ncbi:MAG: hypothetical protein H6739_34960 [Alphaproteobacteria bacterium]|nr:hypothetical protein [Alphaproteobacteria bacterium]
MPSFLKLKRIFREDVNSDAHANNRQRRYNKAVQTLDELAALLLSWADLKYGRAERLGYVQQEAVLRNHVVMAYNTSTNNFKQGAERLETRKTEARDLLANAWRRKRRCDNLANEAFATYQQVSLKIHDLDVNKPDEPEQNDNSNEANEARARRTLIANFIRRANAFDAEIEGPQRETYLESLNNLQDLGARLTQLEQEVVEAGGSTVDEFKIPNVGGVEFDIGKMYPGLEDKPRSERYEAIEVIEQQLNRGKQLVDRLISPDFDPDTADPPTQRDLAAFAWYIRASSENQQGKDWVKGAIQIPDPDGKINKWLRRLPQNYQRGTSHLPKDTPGGKSFMQNKSIKAAKEEGEDRAIGIDFYTSDDYFDDPMLKLPYGLQAMLFQTFERGDQTRLYIKMETEGAKVKGTFGREYTSKDTKRAQAHLGNLVKSHGRNLVKKIKFWSKSTESDRFGEKWSDVPKRVKKPWEALVTALKKTKSGIKLAAKPEVGVMYRLTAQVDAWIDEVAPDVDAPEMFKNKNIPSEDVFNEVVEAYNALVLQLDIEYGGDEDLIDYRVGNEIIMSHRSLRSVGTMQDFGLDDNDLQEVYNEQLGPDKRFPWLDSSGNLMPPDPNETIGHPERQTDDMGLSFGSEKQWIAFLWQQSEFGKAPDPNVAQNLIEHLRNELDRQDTMEDNLDNLVDDPNVSTVPDTGLLNDIMDSGLQGVKSKKPKKSVKFQDETTQTTQNTTTTNTTNTTDTTNTTNTNTNTNTNTTTTTSPSPLETMVENTKLRKNDPYRLDNVFDDSEKQE